MKTIIAVIFLVFVVVIGMTAIEQNNAVFYNSLNGNVISNENVSTSVEEDLVKVTLSGQVQVPGQYEIVKGAYLDEAIEKAGGLTSLADTDCFDFYLVVEQDLNIYIATVTEDSKLSINEASKEELMTLTGIGKTLADRILAYKEEDGGFEYLEELMSVCTTGSYRIQFHQFSCRRGYN